MSSDPDFEPWDFTNCDARRVTSTGWSVPCKYKMGHPSLHKDRSGYKWSKHYDSKEWDERHSQRERDPVQRTLSDLFG